MPADDASPGQPTAGAGAGPGGLLRRAREARGMALEQVADALHLDDSVVVALEEERFDTLGAPVFVRGHLKAYARLVDVSEDEILDAYGDTTDETASLPELQQPTHRAAVAINPLPWAIGALGVLLAIGLAVYVLQDDPEPRVPAISADEPPAPLASVDPEPVPLAPTPVAPPVDLVEPEPAPEPEPVAEAETTVEPEPTSESDAERIAAAAPTDEATPAEAEPVAPLPGDQVTLELYFRGESWTEISDRNRRILFGLQREGVRRELSGEPPFKVLIGNAPDVDIYLNGEPFAVPPGSVTGKVARLTIDAPATGEP
ncbi:MAG: DUF4115 domain-containing protein [Gammaproteobacteria bacterium]|nr:DUF4115 domain-containing protein [Gammaproteobacteria bacterium]